MKKQYKIIIVFIVIIAILLGGVTFYFVREESEDFAYTEELPANISEKTEVEENTKLGSIESVIIHEEVELEEKIELGDIKTIISPYGMSSIIALDENGNVWKWEEGKTKEDAAVIAGVEDVVQIVDTGCGSVYALTSEGDVYAWGMNRGRLIDPEKRGEDSVVFPEPMKLQGLSNIIKIDVANGQAFAVNDDGQLFVWGLGRYKDSIEDYIPSLLEGYQELTDHVEEIYVGAGNFHYFKCKDNQVFSIISVEYLLEYLQFFIVPNFQGEPSASDWHNEIRTGDSERIFDIREEGSYYFVYLYKMGKNDNVALMGADAYTMYVYQIDGSLWYWNSDRITYHDYEWAGASVELRDLDYSGFFEEVDIGSVLDVETDSMEIPAIVSISPGEEGALFLLENGKVLVSEYVTAEIKDVEYWGRNASNPQNTWTDVKHDFTTKKLSLRKLDFENIVNISTDKENKFYLVDKDGNIYCYQMETE